MKQSYIYKIMSDNNQSFINQFQCQDAPFVGYTKLPSNKPVPAIIVHPDFMINGSTYE